MDVAKADMGNRAKFMSFVCVKDLVASIQFNFIERAPYTTKLSPGAQQRTETQSPNPQASTVARKNSLPKGKNLEQDEAYKEEPSC